MNSDEILINTLGATNLGTQLNEPRKLLLDKQRKFFPASQTSGVYQGTINYMLKEIDTHTHSLHDLEAEFVMAFSSSTGDVPYTGDTKFAHKISALSFITGVRVSVNGEQKLYESNIQFLNALRLLEGYSKEYRDTKGTAFGFHPDDQKNLLTQSIVASVSGDDVGVAEPDIQSVMVASPPFSEVLDVNASNRGLMKRLQYIKTRQIAVVNGTVYVAVRIPLKLISKFFEYSIQPVRNTKMEIELEFKYTANGAFFPIQHIAGVDNCAVQVVADYFPARLHYTPITYRGADALKYSQLLDGPYNYEFKMESIRECRQVVTNSTQTNHTFQVSTSVYNPLRLHVLILPTGASQSQSNVNPLHCLELPTSFQYSLQQKEMLEKPYTTSMDFYQSAIQSRQGVDYANDICANMSYDDFVNLYKFVSIDVNRLKSEDNLTNDGLSIDVEIKRASTDACDIICILEEIKSVHVQQSKGLFDVSVSSRV